MALQLFGLVRQFCHRLALFLDLILQYVQVFGITALYTALEVGESRLPHVLEELGLQQAVRAHQPGLAGWPCSSVMGTIGHFLLWLTCMIVSRTVPRSAGSLHRLDHLICFSTTGR